MTTTYAKTVEVSKPEIANIKLGKFYMVERQMWAWGMQWTENGEPLWSCVWDDGTLKINSSSMHGLPLEVEGANDFEVIPDHSVIANAICAECERAFLMNDYLCAECRKDL